MLRRSTQRIVTSPGPSGSGVIVNWVGGLQLGELRKSVTTPDGKEGLLVPVEGFSSSEERDLGGHVLAQRGINWDVFLGKGRKSPGPVTYEHPIGVANTVGFPVASELREDEDGVLGTWTKAMLYASRPKAMEIIELAKTFKEAGGYQTFGWSVEGAYSTADMIPDGKGYRIQKSEVISLAISLVPMNNRAWMNLAASRLALRASGVGYPEQGASQSQPGTEVAPTIPQSVQPTLVSEGGKIPVDAAIAALLQQYPYLTWEEGDTFMREVIAQGLVS